MNTRLQTHAKPAPAPMPVFAPAPSGLLQRRCACGGSPGVTGECAECGSKRLTVQRRFSVEAGPSAVPPIVHDVLGSLGQPLDPSARAFMESRFGHDFSRVRVHTDARAADSARAVNALAYTVGRDVVFGTGQYAPETHAGQRLLAHELTHVMQQGGSASTVQRQEDNAKSPAGSTPATPAPTAESKAPEVVDAAIASLDLTETAKTGATELKKKHPDIAFTSGRRSVSGQASAMASNIVSKRNYIKNTYVTTTAHTKLQDWVDKNPEAKTKAQLAKGLEDTMNAMEAAEQALVSKHMAGQAFDVQPVEKDADAIKKDIKALTGLSKFLEKEDDLVRWHAQFKLDAASTQQFDAFEQEAEQVAGQVANSASGHEKSALGRSHDSSEALRVGGRLLQRAAYNVFDPHGGYRGSTLPYREATELAECIRIMGEESVAYCRQEVLGEQPQAPVPAAPVLSADELTTRIARCIGIWETNRGRDNPAPKESSLDTVSGVHASMATIEQATMPYAITALKGHKELRDKASPPLTMKELNDAEARCTAVVTLLTSVTSASAKGETLDDFIKNNAAAILATGLSNDDVKKMFSAVTLKSTLDTARADAEAEGKTAKEEAAKEKKTDKKQAAAQNAAKQKGVKKAIDAIPAADRLGLGEGSLRAYTNKPGNWGENRAGWQRKAVASMPDNIGSRIEAVAVSDNGTAFAIPVIKTRVNAKLAKKPVPSLEEIVKAVAQQNNPGEKNYGKHVWETYDRLYD